MVDDRLEQVVEKYGFTVQNRYRARGAVIFETDEGLRLMRQHEKSGEHLEFENQVREMLARKGLCMTDRIVPNLDGELATHWETGEYYVMYQWYAGNECDYRSRPMLCQAADTLGKIHIALRDVREEPLIPEETLLQRYERHNSEMKRIWRYMKQKKKKTAFERYAVSCYGFFSERASQAQERISQSAYFHEKGMRLTDVCHGEYNYHNLIFTPAGVAVTNFERAGYGIQLMDFAYFFRKVMEKNNWDMEKGKAVVASYRAVAGMSLAAGEFLAAVLSYPEKYWKLLNHYMNGKKTWIPDKNLEKMRAVREQEDRKMSFLQILPRL